MTGATISLTRYTVGNATFDILEIDGLECRRESDDGLVPVMLPGVAAADGINGWYISHTGQKQPHPLFIDDISIFIVPEPATLGLLGLGGLLLRRRKRA